MKIIKLWGGIGNQLFQYAFGRLLFLLNNEVVYYYFENETSKNDPQNISYFDKSISLLELDQLNEYKYISNIRLIFRIKRKLIKTFPIFSSKVYIEKGLNFKTSFSKKKELFDGYWQSYKYILPIENELREKLSFNSHEFSDNLYIDEIQQKTSISLHIRRGDYLSYKNSKIFEVCTSEYYQKAITTILELVENPVFFVFSNDIKWAKEYLILHENIKLEYVDNSMIKNNSISDLYLMSHCKHHIIANSTFSWWGAWLNPSNEKIVIAPTKWYVGKLNDSTNDLIPPGWIRL